MTSAFLAFKARPVAGTSGQGTALCFSHKSLLSLQSPFHSPIHSLKSRAQDTPENSMSHLRTYPKHLRREKFQVLKLTASLVPKGSGSGSSYSPQSHAAYAPWVPSPCPQCPGSHRSPSARSRCLAPRPLAPHQRHVLVPTHKARGCRHGPSPGHPSRSPRKRTARCLAAFCFDRNPWHSLKLT